MHWDYRDRLRQTDLGGAGTAHYVYDAAGRRVRKVWEKSANRLEERIYLGGFEIHRRRQGVERFERETLHVMDDQRRIAMVETRTLDTAGDDPAPQRLIRYQFGNHLGSVSLELDDQAQIISYEEYTPYGSSSYQAVRSQTETPKRYRYTGMERDEENGLSCHSLRYYMPWVGRWASCDPIGLDGGHNLYLYCHNNSIRFSDPEGTDPPLDAVTQVEVRGGVVTTTETIVREGLHSRLVTTFNLATMARTQRLFRRDDYMNPAWTDAIDTAISRMEHADS
jgi:RHS repeat-associated protein